MRKTVSRYLLQGLRLDLGAGGALRGEVGSSANERQSRLQKRNIVGIGQGRSALQVDPQASEGAQDALGLRGAAGAIRGRRILGSGPRRRLAAAAAGPALLDGAATAPFAFAREIFRRAPDCRATQALCKHQPRMGNTLHVETHQQEHSPRPRPGKQGEAGNHTPGIYWLKPEMAMPLDPEQELQTP